MKTILILLTLLCGLFSTNAQVGIGTTSPEGALDISSPNMGVVVPRVTSIEDAVNNVGGDPINGTILFDQSRNKICFRVNDRWVCNGIDATGTATTEVVIPIENTNITYVKASNTDANDFFGFSSAMSDNGLYFAVGAYQERSINTGINGDESDNSAWRAGAVYVYFYDGSNWAQQAYIKASNTATQDFFGYDVSISNDGSRLVVGAQGEDSNATGINGDESDNSESNSGAAYVFSRSGTTWSQEAYIKASNTEASDSFGQVVSISKDGTRLAVGAAGENSAATGVNGNQADNSASSSGAVFVFSRSGTTWSQEAYIKASNTDASDYFGQKLSINEDGSRLVVGANRESSSSIGINGLESDNSSSQSGAAYVFSRSGTTWSQEAYLKASNTDSQDSFGNSVSLSNDGSILTVGAPGEDSNAIGVNGNQADNSAFTSGAVYVFSRSGTTWSQQAYIKASNTDTNDVFGNNVRVCGSGARLIVSANNEDSDARGINGAQNNNFASASGATYVFSAAGSIWSQTTYIKASNSDGGDSFGVSISCNIDGTLIATGAHFEDSNATGIDGNQDDNTANSAGAVYIINN